METGHRSILVMDRSGHVQGVLAITDLLEMIMPPYLSAPKPSTADSIQFSPMFWQGMFSKEIEQKADMEIEAVMSPAPLTIDGSASLMEAAFRMHQEMVRRLVVVVSGKVAGIIREQDLFFEMEKILNC
jgi:CBS domain-containing protein